MTDDHRTRERRRDEVEDGPTVAPAAAAGVGATPAGDAAPTADDAAPRSPGPDEGRRRRWLVGGAVLGVVVVLAYVLGATIATEQARERARTEALQNAAAASFATLVVERAEQYEPPALAVRRAAPTLRAALEEHLVGTVPVDQRLTDTVETRSAALLDTADTIERLAARPLPAADPLVDAAVTGEVLTALEQLRVEAGALVEEIRDAVSPAAEWSRAVADLDAALAAHADVVERRPDDPDPATIADGWRSELGPLRALLRQARTTARVPGLGSWGAAHVAYAEGTIDFVERAVPLLDRGELDEYNRLLLATFSSGDPFGFQDAARAGAVDALADDPVLAVAQLEERATIVLDSLASVEQLLADRFASVR